MAIENITRPRGDGTSSLVCGHPECDRVAETLVSFTWDDGWSGIIGACWEHHEELAVMTLKARADEETPRD